MLISGGGLTFDHIACGEHAATDTLFATPKAVTASIMSVGTLWRHEKVGRIVMVFKCLREGSIYNVGASLYRLATGSWDER
jgi:hypothetical protein